MTDANESVEVGLMLYRDCQMAMVHGMTDLLAVASTISADRGGPVLRVSHWARGEDGTFRRSFDNRPGKDGTPAILVVPGRLSGIPDAEEAAPYARWLLDRHGHGATLASTCGGAFLLAATGLLSGRPATTHWFFAEQLRDRFPDILVTEDKIVVEDGDIITAGGLMAWTDLGLRLIDRLLGPTVMMETGKFWLIDPSGREQRYYSNFAPRLTHGDEAILKVQHWLQGKSGRPVAASVMADMANLEERTFQRRFKAATGMRPIEYVQHLRVGKAREMLEFTKRSIDQIAWSVGYEDAAAFRRVFNRIVGLTPGEYRQRFSSSASLTAAA
ncbi:MULTISPECIES: GlxA family transcriptional regulator [Novosphingobium]|uniref:Transcriptional regulator, AraC family with amidase-like domain n=1 Tax=Novosphingobium mathurense TaxID=428990 RepID=A0A1U6HZ92_9SPHN|nr:MULTISPECIES: GlxA family transcriptional regulator [Novosphingobium]CDO36252.1 Transcriptional regulator, AraC family [Novosphingobium sp. KN65.2]SLK01080.1 transcriptional regulator, AraC family with amidase-like domain [Novosphingobium mathurense]